MSIILRLLVSQLDHKEVRASQRRLQKRVGKIRSRLSPAEIGELRSLELAGQLVPCGPSLAVNGALRIAAAAKLLKLGPSRARLRPQTARPVLCRVAVVEDSVEVARLTRLPQRPLTCGGGGGGASAWPRAVSGPRRPKTAPVTLYSSHVVDPEEGVSGRLLIARPPPRQVWRPQQQQQRRMSDYSEDSVEVAETQAKRAEMQRALLDNELCTTAELAARQTHFIADLRRWLDANPAANLNADPEWTSRRPQTPADCRRGSSRAMTHQGDDGRRTADLRF